MLTIKRTCANKIITRALSAGEKPFTAVLLPHADDCIASNPNQSLQVLLDHNAGAQVIYNQHPEAKAELDKLSLDDRQIVIELRQETRGVLGLQARYFKSSDDDTIELIYEENA